MSEVRANPAPMAPRAGYDLVAADFSNWHWVSFWRANERPKVRCWLNSLRPGMGLDAGSGRGGYLKDIRTARHRCAQLDISFQMLRAQGSRCSEDSESQMKVQGDASHLPFGNKAFDWVLCTRVLGHVADLKQVFGEFDRVVRPGGEIFISDVHPTHPYSQTVVKTRKSTVCIQTFKHPVSKIRDTIRTMPQLQIVEFEEYSYKDLAWRPVEGAFEKLLRHGEALVFYTCRLRKCL